MKKIDYIILSFIGLFEVFLYNSSTTFQFLFSIFEYGLILALFFLNPKKSLVYFFTITLISIGEWSYVMNASETTSFLFIRGPFFTIYFYFLALFFIKFKVENKIKNKSSLLMLLIFSLLVGVINLIFDYNQIENIISDLKSFLFFYMFYSLVPIIGLKTLNQMIKFIIPLSILMMIASYTFGIFYEYGQDNFFILTNSLSYLIPAAVILVFFKIYKKRDAIILASISLLLIFSGLYFISGKTIIMILASLVLLAFSYFKDKSKKIFLVVFLVFPFFVFLFSNQLHISLLKIQEILPNSINAYKLGQVLTIFENISFYDIALTDTSIGNLFAEIYTIIEHTSNNLAVAFVGRGIGGGVPDDLGLLSSWVYNEGYSIECLATNNFFKMHLPISELFLKFGGVFLIWFIYYNVKIILMQNTYSNLLFIVLFLVFYVSKEMMLTSVILLYLTTNSELINIRTEQSD